MEIEQRLASGVDQPGLPLQRAPDAVRDVGKRLYLPQHVRKDEIEFALWTDELPFPKRVEHGRRHRDLALPGMRLGLSDRAPFVGPLAYGDGLLVEVDSRPWQPAQLRGAH